MQLFNEIFYASIRAIILLREGALIGNQPGKLPMTRRVIAVRMRPGLPPELLGQRHERGARDANAPHDNLAYVHRRPTTIFGTHGNQKYVNQSTGGP